MQRISTAILVCGFLAAASGGNVAANADGTDHASILTRTDRLIVRMKNSAAPRIAASAAQHAAAREHLSRHLQPLTHESLTPLRTMGDGAHVIKLNRRLPLDEMNRIAAQLARDPDVLDVIPDRLYFPQATPTDPQYANQWYLSATNGINIPSAWDISTGNPNLVIAILDTGMLPYNDLAGR